MSLTIDLDRLGRMLRWLVGALIVASFGAQVLKVRGSGLDLAALFDSDQKANLPTGYKILALNSSAVVVWLIARAAERQRDPWFKKWRLLAMVMTFLALDETASVHQKLSAFIQRRFESNGLLEHGWILVYGPAALVVACLLWRFALQLRPATRARFMAAAVLFGGGSGLLEPIKGLAEETTATFYFIAATSDSLEEIGLAVFLLAALRELQSRTPTIDVTLEG
ncbi:MAG: hypothetical protein QOI95_347 [Acidimicrobiaceae bacterium]|jgi:hypothetical protein